MSVHALDKFLNNVFDIYAVPGISSDFTYSRDEYYVTSDDKQVTIEMPLVGMSKDNLPTAKPLNDLPVILGSSSRYRNVWLLRRRIPVEV